MKPESPLPWTFDDVIITSDRKYVIDVGDCNMSDVDAAYVVHACNVYPKLEADRWKLLNFVRHMETQIGYEWLARGVLRDVGES